MSRKSKNNKIKEKGIKKANEKVRPPLLSFWVKRWIKAVLLFLVAIIIVLAFPYFNKAGFLGEVFIKICNFLIGRALYAIPLFLVISGLIFLKTRKKGKDLAMFLAILVSIVGIAGILSARDLTLMNGGWVGFLLAKLFVGLFGLLVANIIFGAVLLIGLFIFLQFVWSELPKKEKEEKQSYILNRPDNDDLKIKGIASERQEKLKPVPSRITLFKKGNNDGPEKKEITKPVTSTNKNDYVLPPLDLLNKNEASPTSGNIKENSMIIKSTLDNFGIPVEMAEVNVGPTVTQYAFKPAEGVKLSKITTLSNNLALALAAHPIRIEAPIPGKSLVGIEVPNKVRSVVTLRNLMAQSSFQNAASPLMVALGRNVSGAPVYADITEGPHLLVAGATGTGKTIFLNTLILSLLYKCTPDNLRMIMVDPKRVEFQHYNDIPHLLCPVIYDAAKTINALQWLTREMERRFEVFSEIPTRNLATYNQNKTVITSGLQMPYIVFVVDELADLMAAKGRELEAGIVRLAQMARATGIHLVLATQRPSVEVITGLIKANVPTRITFQVSSQVDSRTVIDTSGAEKLLGAGDMLFSSAKSAKISRIQGPYISEKEVKKVSDFIVAQKDKYQEPQSALVHNLSEALETPDPKEAKEAGGDFFGSDDPLFEDVKKIVLETQKASASFLQRRLRIGYSRAARLIDMLEEKGIVGPADGAKPREVFGEHATFTSKISGASPDESEEKSDNEDGWT
ncbi:MAG: DNA translocase FtsK 4TM domain-containing protein, partial [Candidatus Staskawiczbacteria bacterium]|nr:DNA translocase FtsK 4TM domain-containing protein [Candidatus Staskawiczbacteria bacterium]